MIEALALLLGAVVAFTAARQLRRPQATAQAASLARTVGGSLGRRKGLDPPELQRACFSEMVRHVRVTRQGRTHAPSRYRLSLHPDDVAVVDEARGWFVDGLADALRQAASDNGWVLDGEVRIDVVADPTRLPGVPAALAVEPTTGDATPPPVAAPATASASRGRTLIVVRGDTGERIPLVPGVFTIGRSRDRTITIDDSRVSRAHAHLETRGGTWYVVDDRSANGTTLRGEALEPGRPVAVRPGDEIGIGPVALQVVAGPATSGEPGTRALDDIERTRISGQVLPPRREPGR